MATETYAPSSGYYSRSDILKARQTGGQEGSKIVSDPSQARTGDYVWSGSKTPSGSTASIAGSGLSTGGAQTVNFDTDKQYKAALTAKNALLEANYNTMMNTLKNNYDTNMSEANLQKDEVGANYQDAVDTIHQQTYDEAEARKVLSAQRGIMNSEQALASRQGVVRRGNDSVNSATKERNQMLNELSTKIANLTKAYGNDVTTAQTNYGLGQTQALNESLAQKLGADLQIAQFNVGEQNKFGLQEQGFKFSKFLQDDQQNWQELQNNLDRTQQMAIAQLNASTQLKTAQISAGAQIQAAKLASVDRRAAQAFVEKQWEVERQDALDSQSKTDTMALLQQSSNYNPSAKVGWWDTLLPWDTADEKSVKNMQQILQMSSAPDWAKQSYIQDMYKTYPGVSSYRYNGDWIQDMYK